MADSIIDVGNGFWNIRGSFKTFGVLDIGTQASLVRRDDGSFFLLDAYTLEGEVEKAVLDLTDGGSKIEAVLHLHPFHTIHVKRIAARFPDAKQYGTDRHVAKAPDLAWEPLRTNDPALAGVFPELKLTVPRGVDFISDDDKIHFSSVLALHVPSRTLHVDDTLFHSSIPLMSGVRFHPTLASALEKRPGAVKDFRAWVAELVDLCRGADHLCAAHTKPLLNVASSGPPLHERVQAALELVRNTLDKHEKRFG